MSSFDSSAEQRTPRCRSPYCGAIPRVDATVRRFESFRHDWPGVRRLPRPSPPRWTSSRARAAARTTTATDATAPTPGLGTASLRAIGLEDLLDEPVRSPDPSRPAPGGGGPSHLVDEEPHQGLGLRILAPPDVPSKGGVRHHALGEDREHARRGLFATDGPPFPGGDHHPWLAVRMSDSLGLCDRAPTTVTRNGSYARSVLGGVARRSEVREPGRLPGQDREEVTRSRRLDPAPHVRRRSCGPVVLPAGVPERGRSVCPSRAGPQTRICAPPRVWCGPSSLPRPEADVTSPALRSRLADSHALTR